MEAKKDTSGSPLKIFRREESLRSRQHRGVCVRVIYEWDSLEILRTEMEPGSTLEKDEVGKFPVIHFVIEGSPAVLAGGKSNDLMPGDSIELSKGQEYRISNHTSSRSTILSIVSKSSAQEKGHAYGVPPQETGSASSH